MSQPRGEPEAPHPHLSAMLICDRAIREVGTNMVTLVRIFDGIAFPTFPATYAAPLSVYARLTDAAGKYRMRLELVRLDDEQAIGRAEVEAESLDRLRPHELTYNIQGIRFERPGAYEFRLFANDRYLGGMILNVVHVEQAHEGGPR